MLQTSPLQGGPTVTSYTHGVTITAPKKMAENHWGRSGGFLLTLVMGVITNPSYIWVFPKMGGTPKWMVYNGKPY